MSRNRHHHNPSPEPTFLTPADQMRIGNELRDRRGPRGLTEAELANALAKADEFCFAGMLWPVWTLGRLTFCLTPEGELSFRPRIILPDGKRVGLIKIAAKTRPRLPASHAQPLDDAYWIMETSEEDRLEQQIRRSRGAMGVTPMELSDAREQVELLLHRYIIWEHWRCGDLTFALRDGELDWLDVPGRADIVRNERMPPRLDDR